MAEMDHPNNYSLENGASSPYLQIPNEDGPSSFRIRPVRRGSNRSKPVHTGSVKIKRTSRQVTIAKGDERPNEIEMTVLDHNGGNKNCGRSVEIPKSPKESQGGKSKLKSRRDSYGRKKPNRASHSPDFNDPFGSSDTIVNFLENKSSSTAVMKYLQKMKADDETACKANCTTTEHATRSKGNESVLQHKGCRASGSNLKVSDEICCIKKDRRNSESHALLNLDTNESKVDRSNLKKLQKNTPVPAAVESKTSKDPIHKVIKRVRFIDENISKPDSFNFIPRKPREPKAQTKLTRRTVLLYPVEAGHVRIQDKESGEPSIRIGNSWVANGKARAEERHGIIKNVGIVNRNLFQIPAPLPHVGFHIGSMRNEPRSIEDNSQCSSPDEEETCADHQSRGWDYYTRSCLGAADRTMQRVKRDDKQELGVFLSEFDGVDACRRHCTTRGTACRLVAGRPKSLQTREGRTDSGRVNVSLKSARRNRSRSHESSPNSYCDRTASGNSATGTCYENMRKPNASEIQGKDGPEPHHHHHKKSHTRCSTCDGNSHSCAEDAPKRAADNPSNQLICTPLTIPFIPLLCDETFTLIMKRAKSTDAADGLRKGEKAPPTVVVDPDDGSKDPMTGVDTSRKIRPKAKQPACAKSSCDTTPSETPSVSLEVTVDGLDAETSNKTKKKHQSVSENILDGTALSGTPSRASLDSDANMSSQQQVSTREQEKTQIHGNPAPSIKVDNDLPVVMQHVTKEDETIQVGVSGDRPRRAPITCWEADAKQDGSSTKHKSQGGDDIDPVTGHSIDEEDGEDSNNDVCEWLAAVGRKPTTRNSIKRDTEPSSVPENDPHTDHHADNIFRDCAQLCDEGLKEENVKSPDEKVYNKEEIQIESNLELNEVPSRSVVESDDEFAFEIRVPLSDATPSPIEMEPVALVPDKPEKSTCTANEANEEDFFDWFDTFISPTNGENDTGIKPVLSHVPPVTYKTSTGHEQSISNFFRPVSPKEDGAPVEVSTDEYDQTGPENGPRQSVEAQGSRPKESASDISERLDEGDRTLDFPEGSKEGGPQHDDKCPAVWSTEPHQSEHELVKNKPYEEYMSSAIIKADYTMTDPEADVKPVSKATTPNWLLSISSSKPEETTDQGPDSKMAGDEISLLESSSSSKPKTNTRRRGLSTERHNGAELLDQLPPATRSPTVSKTSANKIHDKAKEDDTLNWLMTKSSSSSTSSKQSMSTDMGERTRDVRQRGTPHGITDKCRPNTQNNEDISTDWLNDCFGDSPSTRSKKIGSRHSSLSNASLKVRSDPSATDMHKFHVNSPTKKAAIGRRLATPETAAVETSYTKRNQTGRSGDVTNWLTETKDNHDNAKRQQALDTDPIAQKEYRPEHFFFQEEESPGNDAHFPKQRAAGVSQERQESKLSTSSKSGDLDWLNGDQSSANKRKSSGRRAALDTSSSSSPSSNSRQIEGGIHENMTLDFGVKSPTDEDYVDSKKNPRNAERNGESTRAISGCDDWPEDILSGFISKRTRRSSSRPA